MLTFQCLLLIIAAQSFSSLSTNIHCFDAFLFSILQLSNLKANNNNLLNAKIQRIYTIRKIHAY